MRMACRGQARELRACVRGRPERAALRLRYARARGGRANPNPYPSPSTGGWHARLSTQAPHFVAGRGERLVEEDGEIRVLPGGEDKSAEVGGRGTSDGGVAAAVAAVAAVAAAVAAVAAAVAAMQA